MQIAERRGAYNWGVIDDEDVVHVVPLDDSGMALRPHTLTSDCSCHPMLEQYARLLVTHNTIH